MRESTPHRIRNSIRSLFQHWNSDHGRSTLSYTPHYVVLRNIQRNHIRPYTDDCHTYMVLPPAGISIPWGAFLGQVAVIDESEEDCASLCALIKAHGVEAVSYTKAAPYISSPLFEANHVAVISLGQQAFNGLDLAKLAIERSSASHVFAAVEALNLQEIVTAVKSGVADVLQKPISVDGIIKCARGTDPLSNVRVAQQPL